MYKLFICGLSMCKLTEIGNFSLNLFKKFLEGPWSRLHFDTDTDPVERTQPDYPNQTDDGYPQNLYDRYIYVGKKVYQFLFFSSMFIFRLFNYNSHLISYNTLTETTIFFFEESYNHYRLVISMEPYCHCTNVYVCL